MTTLIETARTARVLKEAPRAKADSSAPRHLAIALNGGTDRRPATLEAATAALRTILGGCADSGVAVLTLLRPAFDAEIFDAAMASAQASLPHDESVKINLASPRDGRGELLEAVRRIAVQAQHGDIALEHIGAEKIESVLSTRGLPPIDLLISTGGGSAVCGALVWQSAYAELLFADAPWHAFSRADFDAALADYAKRCRKFGGLA